MTPPPASPDVQEPPLSSLVPRSVLGGLMMGLANLVPGISGGTMLLAAGVYPRFIQAIAEVTTLRFRKASLAVLLTVGITAAIAIVSLAGLVKDFVVNYRWVAYSIFIGLTLGGVPIVWRLLRERSGRVLLGAFLGFFGMAMLALVQSSNTAGTTETSAGFGLMFFAGVAGASAMILPGISGGYLLLVMGLYVPILGGIDAVKNALAARDFTALMDPLIGIVIPVGLGVVVGIALVSHALKWMLARFEQPTLGVLLGLLVGAVVGLWPFQEGVAPEVGSTFKGRVVTEAVLAELEPEDYPNALFTPTPLQVGGALSLIVMGFLTTVLVGRLGGEGSE